MINELFQNFSIGLQGGQFSPVLIIIAFLGGIIASISPCTLGILPIIIGYVGGYTKEEHPCITFVRLLSFVFGLSVILSLIGIICAITGKVFKAFGGEYWIIFMASLIMVFGLNLIGVVEIPIPHFIKRMPKISADSLFVYPFIIGSMFALAATPCSTPILAAIMSFAALSENILYASILLLAFSLGQGVIILLAGVFTSFLKNIKGVNYFSGALMKLCGILLMLASIYLFYKVFSVFIN